MRIEVQKADGGGFVVRRGKRVRVIEERENDTDMIMALGKAVKQFVDEGGEDQETAPEVTESDGSDPDDEALDEIADAAAMKVLTGAIGWLQKVSRQPKKSKSVTTEAKERKEE